MVGKYAVKKNLFLPDAIAQTTIKTARFKNFIFVCIFSAIRE